MKYKNILGLLIALNFSSMFAAAADLDEADAANNSYRAAFTALTRADGTPVDNINEALSGLKAFNPNNDQNISRGCLISLWLRTKVIGLDYDSLKDVMDANPDFFRKALGLSVLYGWAQNWFDNSIQKTTNLSYLKLFHNMADSIGDSIGAADGSAEEVKAFLIAAFDQGLSAVAGDSASFKEFSINNLYLRGAIELANSRPGALLPIAGVIAGVYNTRDQAVAEAVALERVRLAPVAVVVLQHAPVMAMLPPVDLPARRLARGIADFKLESIQPLLDNHSLAAIQTLIANSKKFEAANTNEAEALEAVVDGTDLDAVVPNTGDKTVAQLIALVVQDYNDELPGKLARGARIRDTNTKFLELRKLKGEALTPNTFDANCVTAREVATAVIELNLSNGENRVELRRLVDPLLACNPGDVWTLENLADIKGHRKNARKEEARLGNILKVAKQKEANALLAFIKVMKV